MRSGLTRLQAIGALICALSIGGVHRKTGQLCRSSLNTGVVRLKKGRHQVFRLFVPVALMLLTRLPIGDIMQIMQSEAQKAATGRSVVIEMKKLIFGLVAVVGLSTSVLAADLPDYVAPPDSAPVTVYDWSGLYVGGTVGYGWSDVHIQLDGPAASDPDGDGIVAGAYGGYNYAFPNNVVIGVEADIVYTDIDDDAPLFLTAPLENWTSDIEWMASIRARLGYVVADRNLLFVTGGWAWAEFEGKIYNDLAATSFRESYSSTFDGWTVGVGGGRAFMNNLIARLEYRYSDFGDEGFALLGTVPFHVDLVVQEIRGGIAFKF